MTHFARDNGIPIYWLLFQQDPSTLNALALYQKEHYGTNIEKPPEPKQKPLNIPVNIESEELERLQRLPPQSEGRGGY